ncbi:MAG: hypothetical protein ACK5NG_04810 [Chthoniobacterales bacterium]
MDIKNLNTKKLKSILSLVAKRDKLHADLEAIEGQISKTLSSAGSAVASVAKKRGRRPAKATKAVKTKSGKKAVKGKKAVTVGAAKATKKASGRRGSIKGKIMNLLKAAGDKGVTAKEITSKLGIKNQSVHVWFGNTGKKVSNIVKKGPGHWVLKK